MEQQQLKPRRKLTNATQNRPKQPRYYEETDYERGVRRGKEIAAMEMEDGECGDFEQGTPNERGPTVEESVGALQ